MHNAAMAFPIRVTKGIHIYADHVSVTLNGEPIEHWHEADEVNGWISIEPGMPVDSPIARFGNRGSVVITLNADAPENVRVAYELARTSAHRRC
jgi:hypothetical protein